MRLFVSLWTEGVGWVEGMFTVALLPG